MRPGACKFLEGVSLDFVSNYYWSNTEYTLDDRDEDIRGLLKGHFDGKRQLIRTRNI